MKMEGQRGFSLMEIITVSAILVLIIALTFSAFRFFRQKNELETTVQEIIEILKLAQNKTLASEGSSAFGVYFETDKFTLFKGATFNPADPENQVHNLSSKISISEINLNSANFVVFERLTGATQNNGYLKIQTKQNPQQYQNIFIDASGAISLAMASASDEERIKDSRHTHVLFSQNTKQSSLLTLYFPADELSQNIVYQDFLNPAKTEFLWEGTIVVSGQTQKLKIHTHSLFDTATLFCFHRDRRFNSKALNISLDGQNILNYSASSQTSQGSSAWAAEPQIQ